MIPDVAGRRDGQAGCMSTNYAPARLHRSRSGKIIGGVCAGVARDLECDVNLVRLAAVLLAIVSFGLAVAGYIAAWALLPESD